jgi:hypothetical protein
MNSRRLDGSLGEEILIHILAVLFNDRAGHSRVVRAASIVDQLINSISFHINVLLGQIHWSRGSNQSHYTLPSIEDQAAFCHWVSFHKEKFWWM